MAQEYFKLNGIVVKQPSEDGYTVNFSTTSTENSGRNQYLRMQNTPIGTIDSYGLKWVDLTPAEFSQIMKQVVNKKEFTAHYFDGYEGKWMDRKFYATAFNAPCACLKEGEELWDELSFNMVGVDPI